MAGDRMLIQRLKRHRWMAIPAALLVAACSSMPKDFEAPRVHIADLRAKEMTLFEQRFDVKLRLQSANDADLRINGLRFEIELNDHEFANGMSGQRVSVLRVGSRD